MGGSFFLVLLAMFAIFYVLLIRPQRQQQRKHAELLNQLKVGDEVVTVGGIYGEVVQLDTERVMLEIDDDVRIAVARRAITTVVPPEELERLEAEEEEGEGKPAELEQGEGKPAELEQGVTAEEPLTAEERSSR